MSFEPLETSRQLGSPVALYYFRYGAATASFEAYTDAEHPITAPGSVAGVDVEYTPAPITRKNITASGTLDKASIDISIPRDLPLTEQFRIYPPSVVVSCVIRQGHVGELAGDYPALWVGRVVGFSFEESGATLGLEPFSTSLRRTGLRRTWQYPCPHVLFAEGTCNADKTIATTTVTVTSVSGNLIVLPVNWYAPLDVNKYLNGTVEWTNPAGNLEIRTILQIVGGKNLVLNGPGNGLSAADSLDIILGCDRRHGALAADGDCARLHVTAGTSTPNIQNFGGQPWIPFKNPIGAGSSIF